MPIGLPAPPNQLIGRSAEVAAVGALLQDSDMRIVALSGPGGSGKTRLALHVAWELHERFADGVILIDPTRATPPDDRRHRAGLPTGAIARGDELRSYRPYSDTQPINPNLPGPNAYATGTSYQFYGGILFQRYNGIFGSKWAESGIAARQSISTKAPTRPRTAGHCSTGRRPIFSMGQQRHTRLWAGKQHAGCELFRRGWRCGE
ncbi:MAG: hypothetical protein ABIV47_02660 [Roseiflexaceae bacterium]